MYFSRSAGVRVLEVASVNSVVVVVVRGFLLGEDSAAAVVLASASSCARFFEDLLEDLSLGVFGLRTFGVSMAASADIVKVCLVDQWFQ